VENRGIVVPFPTEATYFTLLQSLQTGTGSQPASYTVGSVGCFSGVKMNCAWRWRISFHLIPRWRTNGVTGLPTFSHITSWFAQRHRCQRHTPATLPRE